MLDLASQPGATIQYRATDRYPENPTLSSSLLSFLASYGASSSSSLLTVAPLQEYGESSDSQNNRRYQDEGSVLASFGLVGDIGISHNAQNLLYKMGNDSSLDAVVHLGDFAYSIKRNTSIALCFYLAWR